jgi:MOSC domain-containing protein YiiM
VSTMSARVLAVNVVHTIIDGPHRRTAIDKRPVDGPVRVSELGLAGDTHCDRRSHGGPDQAVYAYATEDSAWWADELGRELPPGVFGENLTTAWLDVNGAEIGERWRVGDPATGPLLEVRLPRTPCENLSARLGLPRFHQRFAATGTTGAMLKVVATGVVRAGDMITLVYRPGHGVTVHDLSVGPTPEEMERLLSAGIDLAPKVRDRAHRVVKRATTPARRP